MLALNGKRIENVLVRFFVQNGKLIFILSELLSQVRLSGYFRGDGHSFVKAGEKRDKIRDQHRSTGPHGDGALFPVILPDLFDHGFFLHEQAPGVLQLDYIDLYLIHQPYSDYYGAWRTLEKLYKDGKVRAIGVSNFSPERLTDLCLNSAVPPMVNQVELHPFYHQDDALRIMKELGVQPQAWAPLCEGLKNIFSNKILEKTGMKYGKTAAQTALRWNIDRGVSVVTRSSVPEHMREDQDIWDFSLTEAELSAIDQLDLGYSEILDYGNPCIARMFLKKRGIQEEKDDRVIL